MPQRRAAPVVPPTEQEAAVVVLRVLTRDGAGVADWLYHLILTIAFAGSPVRERLRIFDWVAYVEAVEVYERDGGERALMELARWEVPDAQLRALDEPRHGNLFYAASNRCPSCGSLMPLSECSVCGFREPA